MKRYDLNCNTCNMDQEEDGEFILVKDIEALLGKSLSALITQETTIQCSICHKHTKPSDIENNALGEPVCLSCWNGNILFQ